MKKKFNLDIEKYIEPINLNGLTGRCLYIPSDQPKINIMFVIGMHSSMERMYPIAKYLSRFGNVIVPDLPGVGGMDSFYRINKPFSLDSYADYLYTFLKSKKLNGNTILVGMSFGFLIATRMMQKYPQSEKWFTKMVSFVGFSKNKDFKSYRSMKLYLQPIAWMFSRKIPSWLLQNTLYSSIGLNIMIPIMTLYNPKYKNVSSQEREASKRMEFDLWKSNDTRTRFALYDLFLNFNLTTVTRKISVPLFSIRANHDQYFDTKSVMTGLNLMYEKVVETEVKLKLHAPSIIDNERQIEDMFSDVFNEILNK